MIVSILYSALLVSGFLLNLFSAPQADARAISRQVDWLAMKAATCTSNKRKQSIGDLPVIQA
jgi:hypothetical protein